MESPVGCNFRILNARPLSDVLRILQDIVKELKCQRSQRTKGQLWNETCFLNFFPQPRDSEDQKARGYSLLNMTFKFDGPWILPQNMTVVEQVSTSRILQKAFLTSSNYLDTMLTPLLGSPKLYKIDKHNKHNLTTHLR